MASWKRKVERILVRSGLANALARAKRPATAVLAYHNVVPTGEPAAGEITLQVEQRRFAEHLDFILETHAIVGLEELTTDAPDSAGRSRVVVTFDDAYVGTMTAGVEELRSRGLPGTVFVPPGLLGTKGFWWDVLAPKGGGALSPEVRGHALGALGGRQEDVLAWASEQGLPFAEVPAHARPADEATLLAQSSYEGLTLGVHTWSHPNLASIPLVEAREELSRSKSWLQAHAPRYIDWIAFPYGLRTHEVVEEASSQFDGALLIEGGLAQARGRWLAPMRALPRINIPRGLGLEGLALRLAAIVR